MNIFLLFRKKKLASFLKTQAKTTERLFFSIKKLTILPIILEKSEHRLTKSQKLSSSKRGLPGKKEALACTLRELSEKKRGERAKKPDEREKIQGYRMDLHLSSNPGGAYASN